MALRIPCYHCAKIVTRYPSQIKGRTFCTHACRKLHARPEVKCIGCGGHMLRDPTQVHKKYCTWDCFKASRHVTLVCVNCNKPFQSYLSEQRKRESRDRFPCCSVGCRNSYTSKLLGGDGTWVVGGKYRFKDRGSYHHWRQSRQQYLASVGGRCEGDCNGAPATEVHHLLPVAMGGDLFSLDNLMAVCKDCHSNMHWQLSQGNFRDCILEATREDI